MAPRKITPGGIVDILGPRVGRQKASRGAYTGPEQSQAYRYGDRMHAGATVGHLEVDLTPALNKISKVFWEAAELIGGRRADTALFRAINYACNGAYVRILDALRNQTGADRSRIKKAVTEHKATPGHLEWKLIASDKPMALIDFARSAKPGTKAPWASPWNRTRRFKNAFVIGPGGSGRTKKPGAHGFQIVRSNTPGEGHAHKRSGPLNVKILWGPILPKEMLRKGQPTFKLLSEGVPRVFETRLLHELQVAMAAAIAKA